MSEFGTAMRTELGRINVATTRTGEKIAEILDRLADAPDETERAQLIEEAKAAAAGLEAIGSGFEPVEPVDGEAPGATPIEEPAPAGGEDSDTPVAPSA